jgi:hypothetical protein
VRGHARVSYNRKFSLSFLLITYMSVGTHTHSIVQARRPSPACPYGQPVLCPLGHLSLCPCGHACVRSGHPPDWARVRSMCPSDPLRCPQALRGGSKLGHTMVQLTVAPGWGRPSGHLSAWPGLPLPPLCGRPFLYWGHKTRFGDVEHCPQGQVAHWRRVPRICPRDAAVWPQRARRGSKLGHMMVRLATAPVRGQALRDAGQAAYGACLRPERLPGAPSTCAMLWPSLQPLLAPWRQCAPSPRHMLETALHCLLRLLETVFYVS